jgi:hypothetical protein
VVVQAVGLAAQADQAVHQGLFVVQRAADIELGLATVAGAGGKAELATVIVGGALGDRVDHAAGVGLAVQDRGRALEHFDALHAVRLFAEHAEEAQRAQAQAIAVGEEMA